MRVCVRRRSGNTGAVHVNVMGPRAIRSATASGSSVRKKESPREGQAAVRAAGGAGGSSKTPDVHVKAPTVALMKVQRKHKNVRLDARNVEHEKSAEGKPRQRQGRSAVGGKMSMRAPALEAAEKLGGMSSAETPGSGQKRSIVGGNRRVNVQTGTVNSSRRTRSTGGSSSNSSNSSSNSSNSSSSERTLDSELEGFLTSPRSEALDSLPVGMGLLRS